MSPARGGSVPPDDAGPNPRRPPSPGLRNPRPAAGLYEPTDCRPIAARRLAVFQRLSKFLARRRVPANAVSVAGMLAGTAAGGALALTSWTAGGAQRALFLAAALLIPLRLLANLLDGMVAIESGTASPVGELYNEVPDRVSDTAVLVGAGWGFTGDPQMGFSAALLAMLTAYVRTAGKAAGAPHDYRGPMAKQQRMAVMTLAALLCASAPALAAEVRLLSLALGLVGLGSAVTALRRLAGIAKRLRAR